MISEEQRNRVLQDFVHIFKETYGEEWMLKLSSNLTPSPIARIAEEHGLKRYQVKQIRRQIKVIGQYIELMRMLLEPIPISTVSLDESFYF